MVAIICGILHPNIDHFKAHSCVCVQSCVFVCMMQTRLCFSPAANWQVLKTFFYLLSKPTLTSQVHSTSVYTHTRLVQHIEQENILVSRWRKGKGEETEAARLCTVILFNLLSEISHL